MKTRIVPIIMVAISLSAPVLAEEAIPVGAGSFKFTPDAKAPDRTLTVWTHRPKDLPADAPVLIVMHGVKRNGEVYRDSWIPQSLTYGFLLLVPEFPEAQYPSEIYNLVPHRVNDLSRNSEIAYLAWSLDCEEIDQWQGLPQRSLSANGNRSCWRNSASHG